jgi:cell fate (sporulation/competence/biofilm development) regulator YlbF (YheA/YmcA/DUF963 family)
MGWGRYFLLGDLGQQLDLQDRQREMDNLRGQLDSQFSRDANQDEQIRVLRRHNQDLQMYMTALVRLLISKGLVSEAEIAQTVQMVEKTDRSG